MSGKKSLQISIKQLYPLCIRIIFLVPILNIPNCTLFSSISNNKDKRKKQTDSHGKGSMQQRVPDSRQPDPTALGE